MVRFFSKNQVNKHTSSLISMEETWLQLVITQIRDAEIKSKISGKARQIFSLVNFDWLLLCCLQLFIRCKKYEPIAADHAKNFELDQAFNVIKNIAIPQNFFHQIPRLGRRQSTRDCVPGQKILDMGLKLLLLAAVAAIAHCTIHFKEEFNGMFNFGSWYIRTKFHATS